MTKHKNQLTTLTNFIKKVGLSVLSVPTEGPFDQKLISGTEKSTDNTDKGH